jgi:hypothetical protein
MAMNRRAITLSISALLSLAALACQTTSYDPRWGEEDLKGEKADGLADSAEPLDFGETVTGSVTSDSMVLYRIPLSAGDQIKGTMRVIDGDLSPHFTLFSGFSTTVHSTAFDVNGPLLTKDYEIDTSGPYFIAARAFMHQGSGEYELTIECTDGPCAGGPVQTLTLADADFCFAEARECGFAQISSVVTISEARSLFETCLKESETSHGESCAPACEVIDPEFDSDFIFLCEDIVFEMAQYSELSSSCSVELDLCLDDCMSLSHLAFGDDDETPFVQCWEAAFNGTCPVYVRDLESCGGFIVDDSEESCLERCQALPRDETRCTTIES